jgi:hypothetical protein
MKKKTLLFAPAAFDLAETTRMIETAKGIGRQPLASQTFEIQFISNGGNLEHLIEEAGVRHPDTKVKGSVTQAPGSHPSTIAG